ncbi:S8 family peptidase [Chishuiella changwenlii]|uniref:S8 family peptidase n=1 Tax=Chishuiella changwenlii TaxID=1434701 RepID=UPI002FDA43DE
MIKNLQKLTDFKVIKSRSLPLLGSLLLLAGGYASAQYKIDPRFENLIKERKNNLSQKTSNTLINDEVLPITSLISPDGTVKEYYQAIIYTKNADQLKKDGFIIQSESKDFVTALLSENDLNLLRSNKNASRVKLPRIDYLNNQSNVIESGAALLQSGVLNGTNYTGKDILVGVYDTGIDFTHPDFIDPVTKLSRIFSIWDQTLIPNASENSPNIYTDPTANFGVEYTQTHINDEIDGTPANYIREKDIHGHGTHVAGTAAGNGSALEGAPHKGMAPEATLVIVKGGNGGFPATNTIAALDYFKKIADEQGKPIVVNMSIGGQGSAHDGKTEHEIKVNDFANSGPGRIAVISAGNEGTGNIHQRIALAPSEKKIFKIQVGANSVTTALPVFGFAAFSKENNKDLQDITASIKGPDGNTFIQKYDTISGSINYVKNSSGDNITRLTTYNYSDSDKNVIELIAARVNNTSNSQGLYELAIENTSDRSLTFDGWLYSINTTVANTTFPEGDNNYTIGSPGTADEAITVANYVGNIAFASGTSVYATNAQQESLNSSSSKGPRADEARKPDIAAGGTFVISAKTKDVTDPYIIDGKYYSQMTGTSMSSPAVAGGVALLLQANKQLTAKEVKQRLTENVNKDNFTTNTYTNEFGYGKLNIYKAVSAEVNKSNNNTSCPISTNYTAASDNLVFASTQLAHLNFGTNYVGTKLTSQATGKLGNIAYYLGSYNGNAVATIPLTVEIRKVNSTGTPGDLIATKTISNVKTLEQFGWNNLSFADQNIHLVAGQEFFVVLKTGNNANLILVADAVGNGKTYTSANGATYAPSTRNAKFRALVYEDLPAVKQLATSSKTATQVVDLGYNHFVNGCELITRVEANGAAPISGNTTAQVWIDSNLTDFVQRRIQVNATNNNNTSTGKVTLFYSQADFDAYNENATVKLPTSSTNEANKANVVVHYFAGTSDDNTGTPASYGTSPVNTKLTADKVVWNDTYKYWEVTVDAVGFGGYLLSTNTTLSNLDNTLSQLAVYPNPVVNELSVNLPSNVKNAQINIFDVAGRSVIKTEVKKSSDKINVSNLAKGVYIVEIKTTNGVVTKKIIKN